MTHILVFDNDTSFASDLVSTFSRFGLRVEVTADGAAGLASAEDNPPALALITVELPSMQGYKICKRFKKSDRLGNVPVVMLSGEPNAEDTFNNHRKLRMRADDYILKPVVPEQLYTRIQPLIESQMGPPPADFGDNDEPTMIHSLDVDSEIEAFADSAFAEVEQPASALPPRPTVANDSGIDMDPASPQSIEIDTAELDDDELEALVADVEMESAGDDEAPTMALPAMADIGAAFGADAAPPTIAQPSIADEMIAEISSQESAGGSEDSAAMDALRAEAEASSSSLRDAQARIEDLERSLEALRSANDPGRSSAAPPSSREILDLREQINKKDRTLLQLQDEISAKQKEILDLRDRGLEQDRTQSEIAEESESRGRALAEAQGAIETLNSDVTGLRKRLDDMKGRLERSEQKAAATETELEESRVTHKAAIERITADHEIAIAEQEEARENSEQALKAAHAEEKAEIQASHEAATAQLQSDHRTNTEAMTASHAEALATAQRQGEEALQGARDAHATELEQAAQQALAEKEAEVSRLSQEHEAARAEDAAAARSALEQALANAEAEHDRDLQAQLGEKDNAHAGAMQELQSQHGQELAVLSRKMTEAESQAESLGNELETTKADLATATSSIGELNEKVSELTSKLQSVEAIRAQTQADLKESSAALQVAEDKLERVGEAMSIGLAIVQSSDNDSANESDEPS